MPEAIARAFAVLPQQRTLTRAEWARMSAVRRGEVDQRIADLLRQHAQLSDCIGCGCLSSRRCRQVVPCRALGETGEGARRWPPVGKK